MSSRPARFPIALLALAALAVAGHASAQQDDYYDHRYERYDSYDSDRAYDDRRYEDTRFERDDSNERYATEDDFETRAVPEYVYARVIASEPIVDIATRPVQRKECWQEPVSSRAASPALQPGIISAVLATPSATASAGTARQKRCANRTDYVRDERITGYDVTYRYQGRTYTTVTSRDPGDRIRIEVDPWAMR